MSARKEISLPATLVIRDVRAYRATLQDALAAGITKLNATTLTQIDTAGLQLLAAVVAAMRSDGKEPKWRGVTAELADAAVSTDFSAALGLPAQA
jgi:anti-anti-sigma regulatory factor